MMLYIVDGIHRLMVGLLILENRLVKPALGLGGFTTLSRLALDLWNLAFVCGELAGNVGLLGRLWWLGDGENVDVALCIGRLNSWGLVGLEFLEVQVLDQVGWSEVSCLKRANPLNWSGMTGYMYLDGQR